jgi:hypothetical protein
MLCHVCAPYDWTSTLPWIEETWAMGGSQVDAAHIAIGIMQTDARMYCAILFFRIFLVSKLLEIKNGATKHRHLLHGRTGAIPDPSTNPNLHLS